MIKRYATAMIVCLVLAAGCSTNKPPQESSSELVTPKNWLEFSGLKFVVTDAEGETIGHISLLTFADSVRSCGPDMLRAEVVDDSTGLLPEWGYEVGYFVQGDRLVVEFGIPVCDATYEISATLTEGSGEGVFRAVSPWGGELFGNVSVSKIVR